MIIFKNEFTYVRIFVFVANLWKLIFHIIISLLLRIQN